LAEPATPSVGLVVVFAAATKLRGSAATSSPIIVNPAMAGKRLRGKYGADRHHADDPGHPVAAERSAGENPCRC